MTGEITVRRLGALDMTLLVLFVLGIYTGIDLHVSAKIPIPSALAGASGMILLWRRRDDIAPPHLMAFLVVAIVYLGSILSAGNLAFLPKRFTGFVQLIYSLVVSYGVFLTLLRAERRQIATVFLGSSLFILAGTLAEDYGGLRPVSDAVRARLYDQGQIYDADLRDWVLYGRIRPKFFASEPASVTFAFVLVTYVWLLVSRWRWKLLGYLALMGGGFFAMPGPTLLLMVVLLIPYVLLIARGWSSGAVRVGGILCVSFTLAIAFVLVGQAVYGARLHQILADQDASFFYRVVGPVLVTREVIAQHPIAGAGLTGETYIADEVINVYMASSEFSPNWVIGNPLTSAFITNYVWLHWIYLGLVWGVAALGALTLWLKTLGVPSAPFCWAVWAILGQASGAYVGPKTWAVLFLVAACAMMVERERAASAVRRPPLPAARLAAAVTGQGRAQW